MRTYHAHWIGLTLFMLTLVTCQSTDREINLHRDIPLQTAPSKQLFTKAAAAQADLDKFRGIKELGEAFVVERCIKLEAYDIAPLSVVVDIVRIGERLFLSDHMLHQVFQYDMQGSFHGVVGGLGEGPGEYESVTKLLVWRDRLIIYDGGRGQYLVFDQNGNYQKSFDGTKRYINSRSLLAHEDRLYVMGFPGYSGSVPYHAILDLNKDDLPPIMGFGKRYKQAILSTEPRPGGLSQISLQAFALVGQRIWAGSPFQTSIEVFDLEGCQVASLPTGVHGYRSSELKDNLTREEYEEVRRNYYWNHRLGTLGKYVVAFFGKGQREKQATVYDIEGHVLASAINVSKPFTNSVAKFLDGYMVAPFLLDWSLDELNEFAGEQGAKIIMESGYEPGIKEDAMYLIFSKLK